MGRVKSGIRENKIMFKNCDIIKGTLDANIKLK